MWVKYTGISYRSIDVTAIWQGKRIQNKMERTVYYPLHNSSVVLTLKTIELYTSSTWTGKPADDVCFTPPCRCTAVGQFDQYYCPRFAFWWVVIAAKRVQSLEKY